MAGWLGVLVAKFSGIGVSHLSPMYGTAWVFLPHLDWLKAACGIRGLRANVETDLRVQQLGVLAHYTSAVGELGGAVL